MSHHDHEHTEIISEKSQTKRATFILPVIFVLILLLPVMGSLILTPSATATANEDAARAALRSKNLTDLQAADAAKSPF